MGLRERASKLKIGDLSRIDNLENLYSGKTLSREELAGLKCEIDKQISDVTSRLDRKLIDMQTLFEIGKELTSTLNLTDLLQVIIFTLMGNFQVSDVAIFSFDEDAVSILGQRGFAALTPFPAGDGFKEKLSKSDRALQLDELTGLDREYKELKNAGARIVTPVKGKDKLIGFIAIGARMFGENFNTDECSFIYTMAILAGIALENARLYDELNRKLDELSTLYNVSSVINSTDDYDVAVSLILETINTGFGVKSAVLVINEGGKFIVRECSGLSRELVGMEYAYDEREKAQIDAKTAGVVPVSASLAPSLPGRENALFVPLTSAGKNVGALIVYEFEKYKIRETDTELSNLFSVIASQIAPPIITTMMIRDEKHSIRDPFAPVLDAVSSHIERAAGFGMDVTFAMLKLANFNKFVELHGGDRAYGILNELSAKIRERVPEEYEIIRYSSSKLLFILPAVSDSDLDEFKDTVLSLSRQYFGSVQEMDIGIDLLTAKYPSDAGDPYQLLSRIE